MITYLVGGAVRDQLLNFPVRERDWVVIGETPESMQALGFKAVGKDFPVFLHPDTHEEYALARTERKTAPGYKGFVVHADPEVTLEQDLIRRDLTINAIAQTEDGHIVDPYNGQQDLKNHIFRHISPAFSEDPVRILRVARFAARYAHLGFTLAEETRCLMEQMVFAGETDHLVAERVWAELLKALHEKTPQAFFYTLRDCKALATIFPEIDNLFGVPQPAQYHPEIDTGVHCMMVLEQACKLSDKPEVRLAALLHDLGKALSPPQNWPSHHGHEEAGLPLLNALCKRLRIPKSFSTLCHQVMRYHTHCHRALELKPAKLVDVLQLLGAFKHLEVIQDFVYACEADMRGRKGFETRHYPQGAFFMQVAQHVAHTDTSGVVENKKLVGKQIGDAIRVVRIDAARAFKNNYSPISE